MFKRLASAGVLGFVFLKCSAGDVVSLSPNASTDPAPDTASDGAAQSPGRGRVAARVSPEGGPSFIWTNRSADAPVPSLRGQTIEAAARQHLERFAPMYGIGSKQAAALQLGEVHDTGRGAVIASFRRRVSGIEVFGERVAVAMTREREAIALTGSVSAGLPGAAKQLDAMPDSGFTLPPAAAVRVALRDLTGITLDAADLDEPVAAADPYQNVNFARASARLGATRTEPARVKQVLFPKSEGARTQLLPAYYVEADLGNGPDQKPRFGAYVISALDGSIAWKRDLTQYEAFSYRVYADNSGLYTPWDGPQGTSSTPLASAAPDKFDPPLQPAQLVTLSSLESVGVNDPWLPGNAVSTLGNNVDAYVDSTDPDGFSPRSDLRASVSAPGVFDWTLDQSTDANANDTQRRAAVTQLFYNINWFHDWYYAAGFTEAAGNAQFSNYGRGGVEGDALLAEGQDASGFNNANMSTPADGGRPRMQMYLWLVGTSSLSVSAPDSIAGTYETGSGAFTPLKYEVTGQVVRSDPADGCADLVGDYTGKIVLIDRGSCTFLTKTENAQAVGAIGAIVANVATSPTPELAISPGGAGPTPISIGMLTLNLESGDKLRASLSAGETIEATLNRSAMYRDGDVDNQIVAHEWGHYISNRLVFDANGLGTNNSGGLGEGWADFHAMLLSVRPEDAQTPSNTNWNGVYAMAGYATASSSPAPYYYGIRRYPYSTDLSKNPLTFKHISNEAALPDGVPNSGDGDHTEPHAIGEVWANMLWECYAALLRDTLGTSPRSSFAEARDRMRDYIVAAYKVTPRNPTLLEARDALLAVALAADATDYARFVAAFAKRGAGLGAVGPDRLDDTNSGIVESYEVAASVQAASLTLRDDVTTVCTPDGILDNGETGTLQVVFENNGNAATGPLRALVSSSTPGVAFPDGDELVIPALAIQGTATASLHVSAQGLRGVSSLGFRVEVPDTGTVTEKQFLGNAEQLANHSASDAAESSHVAWGVVVSDPSLPAESRWHREELSADNHVYRSGSAPVAASVDLLSPVLNVLPGEPFTLSFKHRFNFEADPTSGTNFDGGVIELSTDGSTWTDVGSALANYPGVLTDGANPLAGREAFVGQSPGYPDYVAGLLDFGDAYAGQQVQLRFRLGSDAGFLTAGWDLDDLTFTGLANTPFDSIAPQPRVCDSVPTASVGYNQVVSDFGEAPAFERTLVTLNGSGSFDADGDPLQYHWLQLSGPPVILDETDPSLPTFTAPVVDAERFFETLSFQLIVDDGLNQSAALVTYVDVTHTNRPPLAVAGSAQTVDEGALVRLDGSRSSDPDGDALSYAWLAPDEVTLSNPFGARPAFIAPDVDTDTTFSFELSVTDFEGATAITSVSVTVRNLDPVPTPPPTPPTPEGDAGPAPPPPEPSPEPDAGPAPPPPPSDGGL